jgi:hypothetical protein
MKKLLFACLVLTLLGIPLAAQDAAQEEQQASGESAQSAPARPKFPVQVMIGEMDLHGYMVTGITANNEDWEGDMTGQMQGKWNVGALNPEWWENRAELILEWKGSNNFGAVFDLAAQNWGFNGYQPLVNQGYHGPNNEYGPLRVPYAFGYYDTGLVKLSVGKLWEGSLLSQQRLWAPDGSAGGDPLIITQDFDHLAARLEIKPIEGLNIGAEYFFVGDGSDIEATEAWKEIALGAEYRSDAFNVMGAVRFDSKADSLSRADFRTYLDRYYGMGGILDQPAAAVYALGPKFKHKDKITPMSVDMSSGSPVVTFEKAPFDGGGSAAIATQIKAIDHVTIQARAEFRGIGNFEEFGYGKIVEFAKYDGIMDRLGVGITMVQQFYGSDVFEDSLTNSPFLTFRPEVSYAIIKLPYMPIPLLGTGVGVSFGVCPDVLDSYVKIEPYLDFSMGIFSLKAQYTFEYEDYKDATNVKPYTRHMMGLGLRVLF